MGNNAFSWFIRSVSKMVVGLLCFVATANAAPDTFSNASLNGAFSWQTAALVSSLNANPHATLGLVHFDGTGNVTGSFTGNNNGNISAFTASGTYSVGVNGTGNLTLTDPSGNTQHVAFTIDSKLKRLELLVTGCTPTDCIDEASNGAAVAQVTSSFTNASLKGSYGGVTNKWGSTPQSILGLYTFDGSGKMRIFITTDSNGVLQSGTVSGTYSVNPDGTGTINVTNPNDHLAFVINAKGKGFAIMPTICSDQCAGSVQTGNVAKQ